MKKGFTLIELLVVISIIGILAALITASFVSSQRQAKDTQRKSDLSQYRTSLEQYANKGSGLYPVSASATAATGTLCSALVTASIISSTANCPEDPSYKSTDSSPYLQYQYQTDSGGIKYAIWAKLENSSNYWVVCANGTSTSMSGTPSIVSCP